MNSFLQSAKWAGFQEDFGRQVFRIQNKLVIKYPLPLGMSYFYSPRPYFASSETFKEFVKESRKLAKKENSIFMKVEPDIGSKCDLSIIDNNIFSISKNLQPQDTLLLDLNQKSEKILDEMHSKTRYNIKLAEKHEIKVVKSTDQKDIDIFYNLALTTAKRDGFRYHERSYYKKMLEVLGKDNTLSLYISYYKDNPTAAIIVMFNGEEVIYLHGASDHNFRNLMSPYLLQWEAIKDAKKLKAKKYDFWGIAPENIENHSWSGITRFKKGFAPKGEVIHYPDAFDLIYMPIWYKIYKILKK